MKTTKSLIASLRELGGAIDNAAADRLEAQSIALHYAGNLAQIALGVCGGRDICTGAVYSAASLEDVSAVVIALRAALGEYDAAILEMKEGA